MTSGLLDAHRHEMEKVIYQRCSYVVRENERVLNACEDLRKNNYRLFGERMFQSHAGLRDEYQVSSPDLDRLVDAASRLNGVLGARMMGAGFGGCTINLVEQDYVVSFVETMRGLQSDRTRKSDNVYVTRIQSGTMLLPIADN